MTLMEYFDRPTVLSIAENVVFEKQKDFCLITMTSLVLQKSHFLSFVLKRFCSWSIAFIYTLIHNTYTHIAHSLLMEDVKGASINK